MNEQELKERIDHLKDIDTSTASIGEIRELIEPIMMGYIASTPLLDQRASLFRSVKLPNDPKPKYLEDIIYPPKKYVTKYGRVNRIGNPVFYCSMSKKAAVLEGRYQSDDLIAVSEWEIEKDQKLLVANVGYTDNLKKWSNREELPSWSESSSIDINEEENKKYTVIRDYLSQLFCRFFDDDHKYKISIAISEALGLDTEATTELESTGVPNEHKGESPFEALLYPSIESSGDSDNLAIRRYSFHKKLKMIAVDFLRIKEVGASSFEYDELDFANSIDDQNLIEWKGRKGRFYIDKKGDQVKLTSMGNNKWTIEKIGGGKLYRN